MNIPPLRTIFWFHHTDCVFCKQAEPVLDAWKLKHPEIVLIKLNTAYQDWEKFGYRPKRTPAYLYVEGATPLYRVEGALLKEKAIDLFIAGRLRT